MLFGVAARIAFTVPREPQASIKGFPPPMLWSRFFFFLGGQGYHPTSDCSQNDAKHIDECVSKFGIPDSTVSSV